MNKEYYTREDMLEWLKKHYSANEYKVETYCDAYLPVRVPLHCEKEKYLFSWGKVPGDDNKKLQKLLKEDFGISWAKNADISKTEDDKTIIISFDKNSVGFTLHEKNDAVTLRIDGQRVNTFPVKKEKGERKIYKIYKTDEIVIEITTDKIISRDDFFPPLKTERGGVEIPEASPVRFYQYYFPKAKIFLAYPDYAQEDDKFDEFKRFCERRGVGLLKTSEKERNIEEVVKPRPLFDEICNQLVDNTKKQEDIEDIIGNCLENYLHYLVYYPEPVYKRRVIIGRMQEKVGYVLIDKLLELKNISYGKKLEELASKYRHEARDDCEIALKCIGDLWKDRLGLKYPEIHRQLEEILLRDEMYREHFVHQFQVFLIGAYILDKLYKTEGFKKVIRSFEKRYKCKIEDIWLAASTYHDFNYGLQNFDFWLLQFFSDTLSIENEEAKEHLNLLNLDAAMVREFLSDIIRKLIALLNLDENTEKKARKFFYEKTVRDRNHGLLSALSILKLCEIHKSDLKVSFDAMLQAAFAITCHDEDIWEALSGCKGYLKSNYGCEGECNRELWNKKEVEIHKQKILYARGERKCEIWEQEFMEVAIIKKIEFDKWPLLFLLIYCDSVQEEGRITSTSFGKAPAFKDELKIEINSNIINMWVDPRKKLKDFDEAAKIKDAFSNVSCELSDKARIYKHKLSDRKWKIVDENLVYILEKKIGIGFSVKGRRKECSLSEINVDSNSSKVKIDLAIDGFVSKRKELERVSWALKDDRFTVYLEEKDTEENGSITINGSGGE